MASEFDVVEVAHAISNDDKMLVETWLMQNKVSKVSDQQPINWIESDVEVWEVRKMLIASHMIQPYNELVHIISNLL